MEISIISKEIIKPSSISSNKPFKISLIDQLIPATYSPGIFFYPSKHNTIISTRLLKSSLSQTLTHLYPFSGRLKNNFCIQDFEQGIEYVESRVSCRMSTFLEQPQMDSLNHFLARKPFRQELKIDTMPLLAIQVNVFDCGGIAIGVSVSHKIADGGAASFFLRSWAAAARGSSNEARVRVLEPPSSLFPPKDPLPDLYKQFWEAVWFSKTNMKTRRFVFSARAVATLRSESRSEHVEYPSRVEALSGFIWKSAMSAKKKVYEYSHSPELSILTQPVNIRPRAKPRLSNASIGNIFWMAMSAIRDSGDEEIAGLPLLVQLLRESEVKIDSDYIKSLQGYDGFSVVGEYLNMAGQMFRKEKPEIYMVTSWLKFGFDKVDFGWGEPIWVGVCGEVGPEAANLVILKESNGNENEIEAWITLEEDVISVMEQDPEFLALASLNPPISIA